MTETVTQLKQDLRLSDWPVPVGWRILVDPLKPKSISDGGILLANETQQAESYLNYIGRVVAMGSLCYKHGKFEGGDPWCKVGDWIGYGRYAGQTITVKDQNAINEADAFRAEAMEMSEQLSELAARIRITTGTADEAEANAEYRLVEKQVSAMRMKLVDAESKVSHQLRILNDDEVLAVIPNTDAIRIYL